MADFRTFSGRPSLLDRDGRFNYLYPLKFLRPGGIRNRNHIDFVSVETFVRLFEQHPVSGYEGFLKKICGFHLLCMRARCMARDHDFIPCDVMIDRASFEVNIRRNIRETDAFNERFIRDAYIFMRDFMRGVRGEGNTIRTHHELPDYSGLMNDLRNKIYDEGCISFSFRHYIDRLLTPALSVPMMDRVKVTTDSSSILVESDLFRHLRFNCPDGYTQSRCMIVISHNGERVFMNSHVPLGVHRDHIDHTGIAIFHGDSETSEAIMIPVYRYNGPEDRLRESLVLFGAKEQ